MRRVKSMFRKKSPLEVAREFAEKNPEEFKGVTIDYFIANNPLTNNLGLYVGFIHSLKIPYEQLKTRRQIEDFTYEPLLVMKEGDYHLTKASDHDWINEGKEHDFIGGEERKRACKLASDNGASLKAIAGYKGVLKGGKTTKNINDMLKVGFDVRCADDPLYGALNCIDGKKSVCIWESVLIDENYERVDGLPQDPSKMKYEGIILDGSSSQQLPFINSFEKRFNELWEESIPAHKILDLVEEKRNGSPISSLSSVKNSIESIKIDKID